jgi:hypothetical protein
MITLPTHNVFIEGPDCSGKTTLIKDVHSATKYNWHLMDRSQVSRNIFSKMYNRNIPEISFDYRREVYNLNNVFVMMIPPWGIIKERFRKRGDDLHDIDSLRRVYDAFVVECRGLIELPNFYLIPTNHLYHPEKTRDYLIALLESRDDISFSSISGMISRVAMASPRREATGMTLTLFEDTGFEKADSEVMNTPGEKDYYGSILSGMMQKIDDELSGRNEYEVVQTSASRRFIYTNDSCISMIHAMYRDRVLDMHVVMRSTNVAEKLEHDLKFIHYLSQNVYLKMSDICDIDTVQLRIGLNSAHILGEVNPAC